MNKNTIKIAIASGKGGTGKSCVASSIIASSNVIAVDADVEEPNLAILLGMETELMKKVTVPIPDIDDDKCISCSKCSTYCRYGAITDIGHGRPFLNPKLCHHCGVCNMVCPTAAINEVPHIIGQIRKGVSDFTSLLEGSINVGMINTIPVIEQTIESAESMGNILVIDSPPGTSCPVVATVQKADFALLVTEPTPFGAADLSLTLQMCQNLSVPTGIVINRSDIAETDIESLSRKYNSPILARFPFSRKVAESYAKGISPYFIDEDWQKGTRSIWTYLEKELAL